MPVARCLCRYSADPVEDEDCLARGKVLIDAIAPALQFHHLPPTVLGAGCSTLAHKFHAVSHAVFLEAGETEESFVRYSQDIVTGTFDLGTEMALPRVLPVQPTTLFPWAFRRGDEDMVLQPEDDDWGVSIVPAEQPALAGIGEDFSYQAALVAPGLLHIIHNAGSALLEVVPDLDKEITKLSHVCTLVRQQQTCERLIETCFSSIIGRQFAPQLHRFAGHVYRGRWGTVAFAVRSMLELERILRWGWNLECYCSLGEKQDAGHAQPRVASRARSPDLGLLVDRSAHVGRTLLAPPRSIQMGRGMRLPCSP